MIIAFIFHFAQIGWALVMFAQNAYHLYVARFLLGFGGAASFAVIPVFVSEIADKELVYRITSNIIDIHNVFVNAYSEFVELSALWSVLAATLEC